MCVGSGFFISLSIDSLYSPGRCVLREKILKGRPRLVPRVSLSEVKLYLLKGVFSPNPPFPSPHLTPPTPPTPTPTPTPTSTTTTGAPLIRECTHAVLLFLRLLHHVADAQPAPTLIPWAVHVLRVTSLRDGLVPDRRLDRVLHHGNRARHQRERLHWHAVDCLHLRHRRLQAPQLS